MGDRGFDIEHEAICKPLQDEPGWIGIYVEKVSGGRTRWEFLAKIGPDGRMIIPFRRHKVSVNVGEIIRGQS